MDITNSNIENSIQKYLNEEQSDYAIMLSAEWGVGKTYFIKNTIIPFLKGVAKREIYVSLIGVDSDEQLERKIFEKINPFYKKQKSEVARESEYLESLIHKRVVENKMPKNIVLVFDDLERINPTYFESAMGFINTYIEHYNTKCIFICNEQKLERKVDAYKEIKEKYIRFTYSFKANFKKILQDKLESLDNAPNIKLQEVVYVFRKGSCFNLRTLFFAISIFENVFDEIENKIQITTYKEEISQLIFNYICFYSIGHKSKGISHNILSKITAAYSSYGFDDIDLSDDKSFFDSFDDNIDDNNDKEVEDNESRVITDLQKSFFGKDPINFQYFESIASYIATGFFSIQQLQVDIKDAVTVLENNNLKLIKEQIENIFTLKNDEYVGVIKNLMKSAEEGELDLISYVSFFHKLGWVKSYNLKGIEDYQILIDKLYKGVKVALSNERLIHVPHLENQIQYLHVSDKYDESFNKFSDFVIQTNNKVENNHVSNEIGYLLHCIEEDKKNLISEIVSNKERLSLNATNAKEVFSALINADTDIIQSFSKALDVRYVVRQSNNIHSPTRENEMEFIKELYGLLENAPFLKEGNLEKMSYVQLHYLRKYLLSYIENGKK